MVRVASRDPQPLVFSVLSLTVAKVDSMGLGGAYVDPVLCGEVVEDKENLPVLCQASTGLGELLTIEGEETVIDNEGLLFCRRRIDIMDLLFRRGLYAFGHLIQDIGSLMNPTPLFFCSRADFSEDCPKTQTSVTDRQLRSFCEPPFLEI